MSQSTWKEAARLIDISAVRSYHTEDDVREAVRIAKQYGFINVHSLPCFTALVSRLLADEPEIYTGAPVGFPGGGHTTETKLDEARRLIEDGVDEMDVVMNIGMFRSGEDAYVLDELNQVIALAHEARRSPDQPGPLGQPGQPGQPDSPGSPARIKTKVIIEINALSDDEMLRACRLVMKTEADFIKTGTGWIAGGANIERIRKMMQETKGFIKVKAAGGIRTPDEFKRLRELGVDRFGANLKSALELVMER